MSDQNVEDSMSKPDRPPMTIRGVLGWGNRKSGLEAYGPDGRWGGGQDGDLLGDALRRAGANEGGTLLVVCVPRFGDLSILDDVERFIAQRQAEA